MEICWFFMSNLLILFYLFFYEGFRMDYILLLFVVEVQNVLLYPMYIPFYIFIT